VPAEVDLTDFAFMPLDVRRLRDSRFTATIDGDAFKVGILLWCASWHQKPAASLPDDDVELAQLAGFGRVVREWKKVRELALYGWVACSDGRLYHPIVAEKAIESWRSKLEHAFDRMKDRLRKANKERAEKQLSPIVSPSFDEWNSGGRYDPSPPEVEQLSGGNPAENALKGTEGTGKGQGELKPNTAPAVAGATPQTARTERKSPKAEEAPRPDDVDPKTWADWCAHRRKKRATVSETVLDGARKEATKAGVTLDAWLRMWVTQGTQGMQASWLGNGQHRGGAPPPTRRQSATERGIATVAGLTGRRPTPAPPPHDPRPDPPQPADVVDVEARVVG